PSPPLLQDHRSRPAAAEGPRGDGRREDRRPRRDRDALLPLTRPLRDAPGRSVLHDDGAAVVTTAHGALFAGAVPARRPTELLPSRGLVGEHDGPRLVQEQERRGEAIAFVRKNLQRDDEARPL